MYVNNLNQMIMEKIEELSFNDQIKINGGGGVLRPYFWVLGAIKGAIENGIDFYTQNADYSHPMARKAI